MRCADFFVNIGLSTSNTHKKATRDYCYMDVTRDASLDNKKRRETLASNVVQFERAYAETGSQRAAAKLTGIPRSTAQYHHQRKQACELDDEVLAFFQQPAGLEFLHRLTVAAEFVMSQLGGCGLRVIQGFYELSNLDYLVASSLGSLHKRVSTLESNIGKFGTKQEHKLSKKMPHKAITCTVDETFPSGICLVGMEPRSNFILLEEMARKRDCDTWEKAMSKRLEGLPVTVFQVTSDEAKALIKYTEQCLGAHHSPDLFHIQQEVSKGTAAPLRAKMTAAERLHEQAILNVNAEQAKQEKYESLDVKPKGRPVDYDLRVASAEVENEYCAQALKDAENRREKVREASKSLGQIYHPFNMEDGKKRSPDTLCDELNSAFNVIEVGIQEAELSENSIKHVEKARRMTDSMVSTLTFFWAMVGKQLEAMKLPERLKTAFLDLLLPATYIEIHSAKGNLAEVKNKRLALSQQLYGQLAQNSAWQALSANEQVELHNQATECAHIFQRSSSNVEGRNGQLSLLHHVYKKINSRKMAASTVIHNYFIRRQDGTTAAERFFEHKPDNLFTWLLSNTDYPALPAKRRSRVRYLTAVA